MPRKVSDKRAQQLRRYWDKHARNYDKQIAFWERRLFGDGRQWVCAQASGDTLEVAIGTGSNLPYYPQGIRLTGIEFSPASWSSPAATPNSSMWRSTCAWVTPRRWTCPTPASTGGVHPVAVRHP
jgi:hypothetical protein